MELISNGSEFSQHWFRRARASSSLIEVVSETPEGFTVNVKHEADLTESNEYPEFKLYQQRPEYFVGLYAAENVSLEEKKKTYCTLLAGSILMRYQNANKNVDAGMNAAKAAIDWLTNQSDFFTAPASTIYHESFEGGLLTHTLKAYNRMLDLMECEPFCEIDIASATFCILSHDWCKIGLYESYMKNVKDEQTGTWHQEKAFKHNAKGIALGHGTSSMFLASRFVKLSAEEACAIRWHMGAFYVTDGEINDMQRANETYPMVHLIQFADQLSIVNY